MNIKSASKTALLIALTTGAAVAAASDRDGFKRTGFISPLTLRFVLPESDPRLPQMCERLKCPQILTYGGGIPTIDPAFKANLPNVRVSFVVQEVTHEAIAGGGVDDSVVVWETHSPATGTQNGGPYMIALPPPGESWNGISMLIYDALVFGACDNFSSFPVTHIATVNAINIELGSFAGTDDSTLSSTGFYNLNYTVEADDGAGVSRFHIFGKVNATCSGANAL